MSGQEGVPISDPEFIEYINLLSLGPRYNQGSMDYVEPWLNSMAPGEQDRILSKLKQLFISHPERKNYPFIAINGLDPRAYFLSNLNQYGIKFSDEELQGIILRSLGEKAFDLAGAAFYIYKEKSSRGPQYNQFMLNLYNRSVALLDCDYVAIAVLCVRAIIECNLDFIFSSVQDFEAIEDNAKSCETMSDWPLALAVVERVIKLPSDEFRELLNRLVKVLSAGSFQKFKMNLQIAATNRLSFYENPMDDQECIALKEIRSAMEFQSF